MPDVKMFTCRRKEDGSLHVIGPAPSPAVNKTVGDLVSVQGATIVAVLPTSVSGQVEVVLQGY